MLIRNGLEPYVLVSLVLPYELSHLTSFTSHTFNIELWIENVAFSPEFFVWNLPTWYCMMNSPIKSIGVLSVNKAFQWIAALPETLHPSDRKAFPLLVGRFDPGIV